MFKPIFLIFAFCVFTVDLSAQYFQSFLENSSVKKDILETRERDRTKPERLKRDRERGLNYNSIEFYPTATMIWGKGFYNGLAKITVEGKIGFINTKGKVIVNPTLKDAGYFADNLAPFESENGKWGFIDRKGQIAINPQFDWALSFKEGLAIVQIGELWGFIDRNGIPVIELKFEEASSFSEGLAKVRIKDTNYDKTDSSDESSHTGFIDKQGNWAIKPIFGFDYSVRDFNGGKAIVSYFNYDDNSLSETFYIDKEGRKISTLKNLGAYSFSENTEDVLISVIGKNEEDKDLYSLIDRSRKRITEKNFAYILKFSDDLAMAQKDGSNENWGFINKNGDFVIKPIYFSVKSISEGLAAAANKDNDFGFIDKSGNWVIKPQFEWVDNFKEGFALVAADGRQSSPEKFGYIDRKGNYIWKPTK